MAKQSKDSSSLSSRTTKETAVKQAEAKNPVDEPAIEPAGKTPADIDQGSAPTSVDQKDNRSTPKPERSTTARPTPKPASKPTPEPASKPSKSTDTQPGKGLWFLTVLSILLALLAGLAIAWLYYYRLLPMQDELSQVRQQQGQFDQNLRTLDNNPTIIELKRAQQGDASQLKSTIDGFDSRLQSLTDVVAKTNNQRNENQRDWVMAEVAYLLNIASTRLALARDTGAAVAALTSANRTLGQLNDPSLLNLRQTIADDLTQLRLAENPDVAGVTLQISSLIQRVSTLPLAAAPSDQPLQAATANRSDTWWQSFLRFLGFEQESTASLRQSLNERFDINQQLMFALEGARQAALRLDQNSFEQQLKQALSVLDKHYQKDQPTVTSIADDIRELVNNDQLFAVLPELTASIDALREVRAQEAGRPQRVAPDSSAIRGSTNRRSTNRSTSRNLERPRPQAESRQADRQASASAAASTATEAAAEVSTETAINAAPSVSAQTEGQQ